MPRRSRRLTGWLFAAWLPLLAFSASGALADCPQQDLTVTLNTGWDESTGGVVIPAGGDDDDWDVTASVSGGTLPRNADVVTPNPAWLTFPDSGWIAADQTGPNGTYVYETCWCLDEDFSTPELSFQIRADDQADVLLNGTLVTSLPDGTFNDAVVPTTTVTDPALFVAGRNCLEVIVENKYGVVTGFNLAGTVIAGDGLCCDCDPQPLQELASTGIDDQTNTPIASGDDDDEWTVVASASGGVLPRPAEVIDTFAGWNVIPGTKWITADETGPNGLYVYEKCWCMDGGFQDPQLSIDLLADDRADVYLNGTLLGSTPATNAFLFPATSLTTNDPELFRAGRNCVTIEVDNVSSVVTGLDVAMTMTADAAQCCECVDIPPDAEGWWPLNETTGPTAFEPLNAHDGTWSELSAMPPAPFHLPGKVLGSLTLDGNDDYVEVPDAAGLNFGPGQDFSFDAWVKTGTMLRQAIVFKRDQLSFPSLGYSLVAAGTLTFEMGDGVNGLICNGVTSIADDQWHFVAVTVDRDLPGGIRIWVDGAIDQVCDPTPVAGDLTIAQPLFFGGDANHPPNSELFWKGQLDEIEIFRRALTIAEVETLYGIDDVGKCPLDACEDSSGVPVCDGTCDPGLICVTGPVAGGGCECVPESATCGTSDPTCDGPCPDPDEVCVEVAGNCECQLPELCEGFATFPECDGLCPDSDWVCESNGQRCHCVPPATPCEMSAFPECGGDCPIAGDECQPDDVTGACACPGDGEPPPCEGFATFPECDGECPPGQVCENNGQRCHCEEPAHCGDEGDYPVCDLPCPDGFVCDEVPGAPFCACVEDTTPCEDTLYPECDGVCPRETTCTNVPGSDLCECVSDAPPCGSSLYPTCDGSCPQDDEVCRQAPDQSCDCLPCEIVAPDPVGPVIHLASGHKLRWTPVSCALTYDVYRLVAPRLGDADGDGLADDYGRCFQNDVIGTETTDAEVPQPGLLHWYLVTAKNFNGQTTLGETSGGQTRQATIGCP